MFGALTAYWRQKSPLIVNFYIFIEKEQLSREDYWYALIRMGGTKRELILREHPQMIVTQGDVRQVQLAKGAILSRITALLKKAGLKSKKAREEMKLLADRMEYMELTK